MRRTGSTPTQEHRRPRARRVAAARVAAALVLGALALAACGGGGSDTTSDPTTVAPGSTAAATSTVPATAGTTIDRAAQPGGGEAPLQETVWVVVPSSLGIPVPAGSTLALKFAPDGNLYGRGVCNTIAGTYQATATALLVTQLGATEVGCGGNEAEAGLMAVLTATRTYDAAGANLVLKDERDRIVLRLEAGDPALIPVG